MARASDPRPARTRAAVHAAVERLTARGETVTVPTLVAESGVSRSTFYALFGDIDTLAVSILSDAFAAIESEDLQMRRSETPHLAAPVAISRLVAEFARNRALIAGALSSRASASALRAIETSFAAQALGTITVTAPAHIDPEFAADHLAGGTIAVLTRWVLADDPAPAAHVQQQLLALLPDWLLGPSDPEERKHP